MSPVNKFLRDPLFTSSEVGKALRQEPLGFIDIGARGGIIADVAPLAGVTAALAFDPDPEECEKIAKEMESGPYASFHIAPCAIARENRREVMNLYKTPSNNSFLKANQPVIDRYGFKTFEGCGAESLPTRSLDSYLFEDLEGNGLWGELIKLDTQGMEHDILSGAQRTLAERTVAVIAEVEFFQLYAQQPLFSEVEQILRGNGFSFYGFSKMSCRSLRQMDKKNSIGRERMLWADAIFFKDPFAGGFWNKPLTERQNYALFASALLLGYYDFALEVALKAWAAGEEAKRIRSLVNSCSAASPEEALQQLRSLSERVETHPHLANVEIGRFVDERRYDWDYDDVPKTV